MNKSLSALMVTALFFCLAFGCAGMRPPQPVPTIKNPVIDVRSDPSAPLLAGFAKEAVTPKSPVFIAGFGIMRLSVGAHDDIFVRSLVIKQGGEKLAMVSIDVIGLQRTDVLAIKAGVAGYRPEQILIHSTHTHAGPDTLGLWGLPPLISGRSQRYVNRIGRAVAATIARADADVVPVDAATAAYQADPTIMINSNEGEPEDHHMGLMVFRDQGGAAVATILNVVGHPEAMWDDNHYLSADFAGRVCELVEENYGGGAIFFSGALGGIMTPARPGPGESHDFPRMERISQKIFADVVRGMDLLVAEQSPALLYRTALIPVIVANDDFKLMMRLGLFDREIFEGDRIVTEVSVIEIGSAHFVTFPGEAYPKQGLKIRAEQKPHSFQIALANDELGYILYPDDYASELYEYEASVCVGPTLSERMEEALLILLEE